MGLQLRVIDGIRMRVVQVEERDGRRPVRVGSAADCDIRVGAGAPLQCELFVHRGRWAVRSMTAGEATRVNGKVISKGAYLSADDRITLGDSIDAAVIELGPAGVAAGGAVPRPAAPDAIPELVTPGEGEGTWFGEDEDEVVPLNVGAADGGILRSRRGPRRSSNGWTGWTVLLTLLVGAGGGVAIWKLRPGPEPVAPVAVVPKEAAPVRTTAPSTAPSRAQRNIFDAAWQPAETAKDLDPRKREEDWLALEKAVSGPSAARAIYAIEGYREKRPGQFEAELQGFLDQALDRIWWERIEELCGRRDELKGEIQQLSNAIAEETEEDFRKKLEEERTGKEGMLRWTLEALNNEMGYAGKEAPNVADEEMIAHLREQRDAKLYQAWKDKVVKSILHTRGYLPWEQVR